MDQQSLRERLAKLHAELANAHQQNPATRQSLGEILPDVKRMVDLPADAAADPPTSRCPSVWREWPCSSKPNIRRWPQALGGSSSC